MSSTRNTIMNYMGYYFVLPRDPPSELKHLGEEAHRRYNWYLVATWYKESQSGRYPTLDINGYGNKFTDLSNTMRQALVFTSIEATLQDVADNVVLDVDSGQYHMPSDNTSGKIQNRPQNNTNKHSKPIGFIEYLE